MKKYFDKTFFKFLSGFILILLIGFAVLFAVGYYQVGLAKPVAHLSNVDLGDQ